MGTYDLAGKYAGDINDHVGVLLQLAVDLFFQRFVGRDIQKHGRDQPGEQDQREQYPDEAPFQ